LKLTEKILFALVMVFMILPAVQKEWKLFHVPDLHGDFVLAERPDYNWDEWYSGNYQTAFDTWLEEHIGFRNTLIRITNQIDFSLFQLPHAEGVVFGKENMLFEYDYIRAYAGGDFLGEKNIDKRIRRLKFVQEYLKKELNIDFVLVFEPGKASYYPEYIPDSYLQNAQPETNYTCFTETASSYDVRFIDFNQWFKELKPNTAYPLYAQYGTHWSSYGTSFAIDSLVSYMENLRNIDLREVIIDTLYVENKARTPDYDIGNALNLYFRLPEHEKLAYPEFKFGPSNGKYFPRVLVIADSYYWNIFNTNLPYALFKNQAYWYFGNLVYPETYKNPTFATNLNLQEEVEKQEIVLLMVTERFLHKFDWGFVDNLYRIYGIESTYDQLYKIKAEIWIYTEWFDKVVAKAEERNIPLSEMLELEARYVYQTKDIHGYMTLRGQEHFEERIHNDPNWLENVRQKAEEEGIDLNEMVRREADYMFKTNHPEAWETYHQIQYNKQHIQDNQSHVEKVKQEAKKYYLTLDEMLQIEAERMLRLANHP
jgi:hypothetical protein